MKEKKIKARARKGKQIVQVAALPFRRSGADRVEFMLLTSRGTRRFVLPKGWPMKGMSEAESAAIEAEEEAGIQGQVAKRPIGRYRYWKRLRTVFAPITVAVFPLLVEKERDKWNEMRSRNRAWLSAQDAALLVDEPDLIQLFREMADFEPDILAAALEAAVA
ncbi:MAG: NUDIX hydrolase [Rhizobiaceae bacterium]|nr:NUDIX hydrolase [Rhizobiaceae bacterium]